MPHPDSVVLPVLMTVAKAVAGSPTWTDRAEGSTAALSWAWAVVTAAKSQTTTHNDVVAIPGADRRPRITRRRSVQGH